MKRRVAGQAVFASLSSYTGTPQGNGITSVIVIGDDANRAAGTATTVARTGTLQSATATTAVLDTGAHANNDTYNGGEIEITGGTGSGQTKTINDYTGSTKTVTVSAWTTTPDGTSTFEVRMPAGKAAPMGGTSSDVGYGLWKYSPTAAETDHQTVGVLFQSNIGSTLEVLVQFETEESNVLVQTTIATLASQTSFTLTNGSADDNAYNGHIVVVRDATTWQQVAVGIVSDYTGASKTVTLAADPGIFTMAAGDDVTILANPMGVSVPEPAQGTPAATTSLLDKLGFLYKAWRNKKTQTATQYSLFNDDAATVDHKATVSDDGTTTTIGEVATGP